MRKVRWAFVCGLGLLVIWPDHPRAQQPLAHLYGIGDLPGGRFDSVVQDATSVGGTIYAVGSGNVNSVVAFTPDVPLLWTFDGTTSTLTVLPNVVTNPIATSGSNAFAITPDARFIASQIRNSSTTVSAVRVEHVGVSLINVAVGAASARVMSNDGTVVYSHAGAPGSQSRVARWNGQLPSALIDLLPGMDSSAIARNGTSADGTIAVGTGYLWNSLQFPTNPLLQSTSGRAFRYIHGLPATVSALPLPAGGTWSQAAGVSPDGRVTLLQGNSSTYPSGEYFLHDAVTGALTSLGSPNPPLPPQTTFATPSAGMTADGVVVVTVSGAVSSGYIKNEHGWFSLTAALAAAGVDAAGTNWDSRGLTPLGVRTVDGKDLVYGRGRRDLTGTVEGFVAVFPQGFLASFNPQPEAPQGTSIVGAWKYADTHGNDGVFAFLQDGTFYQISTGGTAGFERGLYRWNGSTHAFSVTILRDTNSGRGISDFDGSFDLTVDVVGDMATLNAGATNPNRAVAGALAVPLSLNRVVGAPGLLTGAWATGNTSTHDSSSALVLLNDGTYLFAQDGVDSPTTPDGIERGTYAWNPIDGSFVASAAVDTNGSAGPSNPGAPPNSQIPSTISLAADGRSLTASLAGGPTTAFTRTFDPTTAPAITNAQLTANGVVGATFSYVVTGTNVSSFAATNLPSGLFIDPATGAIGGTPSIGGQFAVVITASNAIGITDIKTLTMTVSIPTPVGQNVVVQPEVPAGQGPVTMTFGEITTAGTTTVSVIDPAEAPPVGNVSVAGVVYEVETTATFNGLVALCFSYAGVDFGSAEPRLFHFEHNQWIDITTSVDPSTQTICGATTSLSPFAVFVSHVVRSGFYAPVSQFASVFNTVKGGSTVPLKFNVAVDGIQQTSTAGLSVAQQVIPCDSSAPSAPVQTAASTGGTSLRYDAAAGYFIQNWKVPSTPNTCYLVRMVTASDGLALTARFKVK